MSEDAFLSRWSRLKKRAKDAPASAEVAPKAEARPAPAVAPPAAPPSAPEDAKQEPAPLPPVESLTPESDFTPFMDASVDESLKRRALRTLFQDPRFNVMDGLDTYIGDYSQPDPLPEGWLEKMGQLAHLGDQPARLEAERKAAEETRTAAAETAPEVKNPLPDEQPATTAVRPPSDTFDPPDEALRVGQSQDKDKRLI